MKRIFDVMVSLLLLLLLAVPMLLVSLAILLDDGMPVLFRHERVGRFGQPFTLLKFRTMHDSQSREKGGMDPGDRSRVSRFGRILRSTKVDEWPQVINVLRGEMSLVGPRPEVAKWVDAYASRWEKILELRPGITDKASLVFRDEEEVLSAAPDPESLYRETILPRKLDMYEMYRENRSFRGDLGILFETFLIVARIKKNKA